METSTVDKILVVEDDLALRELITLVLGRLLPVEIVTAENGMEALKMYRLHRPQVMVIDILLPQLNGLDILRQLQQSGELKTSRAIVISALGYREVVQQALAAGAQNFIVKPFDVEVLVKHAREALEQGRP